MKNIKKLLLALLVILMIAGCSNKQSTSSSDTKNIKLLATSDMHGKFINFDYALNTEENSGSIAQISTAIKRLRDDNTVVIDAGDFMQANYAELFIDDDNNPIVDAMNHIGYDVQITGNHEYNYGMEKLTKLMTKPKAKVITGNVYDSNGNPLWDAYTIIEKDGVKIGFIGMVTPIILYWDSKNLANYKVTDPVEETKKIISEIKDQCDVLVGVMHMGENNEYEVAHTGAIDLANECPELDVIIASHEHKLVENEIVNGVLIVENKDSAKTLQEINLTLEKQGDKYKVVNKESIVHDMKEETPDPEIIEITKEGDAKAKAKGTTVIGTLENGPLVPEQEIKGQTVARLQETKLVNLINNVMMYYSGADIAATAVFNDTADMKNGEIKNCDIANIYKYTNTLATVKINGKQLKKYMEWSANYYNTYKDGDLILAYNPDIPGYNYDMFTGIKYEVNVAKEPGNRIENLRKMDDTPIKDSDEFIIAVNDYRANTQLLKYGSVFKEGEELPTLVDIDIRANDIGGIRELIVDYIKNVNGGVLVAPELTGNWKIVGNNWNEEDHKKAIELINSGKIQLVDSSETSKKSAFKPVTKADIDKFK